MKKVKKYLTKFSELVEFCKKEEFIYIQPHNFPDHDAIASAFGLKEIFNKFEIKSKIVYDGDIQRDSLKNLIKELNIKIKHIEDSTMKDHHKIIVVDGSKGNSNVTDFIGDEIGVIDHHSVKALEDIEFSDIRPGYGACSSIIFDYYKENNIEMSQNVATALMIGINVDTAMLTRKVHEKDLEAFVNCYTKADVEFVNFLLRNSIKTKDLEHYKYLLNNFEQREEMVFCYFPQGCDQNLLGILADFMLGLQEIRTVMLCADNSGKINISMRNEVRGINLAKIILELLEGIGLGGGHENMAGGIIFDSNDFDEEKIKGNYYKLMNSNYNRAGLRGTD